MKQYQRILIAVDLSSESEQVLKKAQCFAGEDVVSHLVYVQEPMDNVYVGIVPQSAAFGGLGELEAQMRNEYIRKLDELGEEYGVSPNHRHILNGVPAREIHRFTKENDIQLIVIGTHGQKGWQLLLGSTANAVLHGAQCDVLSCRIASK